jgi:hypothetical protein
MQANNGRWPTNSGEVKVKFHPVGGFLRCQEPNRNLVPDTFVFAQIAIWFLTPLFLPESVVSVRRQAARRFRHRRQPQWPKTPVPRRVSVAGSGVGAGPTASITSSAPPLTDSSKTLPKVPPLNWIDAPDSPEIECAGCQIHLDGICS